eukprot:3736670-Rhodomonas_salina.3
MGQCSQLLACGRATATRGWGTEGGQGEDRRGGSRVNTVKQVPCHEDVHCVFRSVLLSQRRFAKDSEDTSEAPLRVAG